MRNVARGGRGGRGNLHSHCAESVSLYPVGMRRELSKDKPCGTQTAACMGTESQARRDAMQSGSPSPPVSDTLTPVGRSDPSGQMSAG